MQLRFSSEREFTQEQLQSLFRSVGWISANYPEKLFRALNRCETVFTAWDGCELVGLVNAIDDGELTAYIHYLLVRPEYQSQGIGRQLLTMMKDHYSGYLHFFLVAEHPGVVDFYKSQGFVPMEGTTVLLCKNKSPD